MTDKRLYYRWIYSIIASLATTLGATAQTSVERPAIVVGITVEGLSDEYLDILQPYFTEGGFKKLMRAGAYLTSVAYGPGIDPAAATAMIYTGASPMVNGIPAAHIYNVETNTTRHILYDPSKMGNFTDETYSPVAIKVSTLADEVRVDSDGDGYVYSVAPQPHQAIIAAGHAANGAYWLNGHTGNWATSTYYPELNPAVNNRNYRSPLSLRIDTMQWTPAIPMEAFPLLSRNQRRKPFKHTYPRKQLDSYSRFRSSALGNAEVTALGLDIINTSGLGKDAAIDMLSLAYSVDPAVTSTTGSKAETIDSYIRLDRELAKLFDALEKTAGRNGYTVFVAGIPSATRTRTDNSRWRIPSGQFSVKKANSLLDMYLMAVHGNGDWVLGYFDKQFYLNRKLIKDRGLDLAAFRGEVADFLARMSGVSGVHTIDDIIASRAGDYPQALKRNTSVPHAGDVFIEINPGWEITDDGSGSSPVTEQSAPAIYPVFLMGPQVGILRIDTPTDARSIAPTVAKALHIRSPNAASLPPVQL